MFALLGPVRAQGQSCHRTVGDSLSTQRWTAPLDRRIPFQVHDSSLRDALDRVAAAARIRLSYSGEQLPVDRVECVAVDDAAIGDLLVALLHGTRLWPVVVAADQIALTPRTDAVVSSASVGEATRVGVLERVVVTGTATGGAERPLTIALDVVSGHQLARRNVGTLSEALDGSVPGLWSWAQSPSSLLTSYGSIRGASSFGLSYPKMYIDGIEVANPLLVSRFNADAIDRVEVIRGPQGSALYGTDAISGVVNIVTRHEGADLGGSRVGLRAAAGMTSSDFAAHGTLTQDHALSYRGGTATRSAGFDIAGGTTGNYVPNAYSQELIASANTRLIASHGSIVGTARFFAQRAGAPSNPLIATWRPPPGDSMRAAFSRSDSAPQRVQQYTIGATGTLVQSERWTHSLVAGVDGYRLANVASNETPLVQDADSALRAAEGGADRATVRLSSVARFGAPENNSATLTFALENASLREATRGEALLTPDGRIGAQRGLPPMLVTWQNTVGLTAQANTSIANTLFVTAGTRLERNDALTASRQLAVLPMFGVSLVRDDGPWTVKLRSAYGKGIRPPQTATHATVWQSTQRSSTQPTLGPEEQSGVEAGVDLMFQHLFTAQVTRFDQRASGLIQQVAMATVSSGPGSRQDHIWYTLQNVGEITNRGWELQGQARLGYALLTGTWATVDSRVASVALGYTGDLRTGDRMLGVPARTAGLSAAIERTGWTASLGAARAWDWINYDRLALARSYITESHSAHDLVGISLRDFWRRYDGSTRLRATASRELRTGFSIEATGDNLLGYQRGEPDNVTVVPGRTILTGVRVRF